MSAFCDEDGYDSTHKDQLKKEKKKKAATAYANIANVLP